MTGTEFHELLKSGLGRPILYASKNDVRAFRDVILDACLHCYSADTQCEGTRAGYMLKLVDLLPDRQFYRDEVLKALPRGGDDWDAAQRFDFATCMALDGDERARQAVFDYFDPGPKMGEAIAIDLVRLDGLAGLIFAAEKIGSLLMSKPEEVDSGWLWCYTTDMCGEQEAKAALAQAGAADPRVETYRLAVLHQEEEQKHRAGKATSEALKALSYEQLKPRLLDLRAYRLSWWGRDTSTENLQLAPHGLLATQIPEEQIRHLRIFSQRPFPLDPSPLLEMALSDNEKLAFAAANAVSNMTHPSIREVAFQLVENSLPGRESVIAMLDRNWMPGDHEIVLRWFGEEQDREVLHRMQRNLREFWELHPEPASEPAMLRAIYERGPCSFCREFIVKRLIELNELSPAMRAECAHDASDEVRQLVGAE